MKVSPQDADLFFELMWPLQFFVKQKLQLLPDVKSIEAYANSSPDDKMPARQALYEHPELIDEFLAANQQQMPEDHLDLIRQWKQRVSGRFYLERILKSYAIFISAESDNTVYGVVALHDEFDEIFDTRDLPLMVNAVLLPFKGKVIYDGLLLGYNIFFGSGIRGDLKETYLAAKQQGRIIESFEKTVNPAATAKKGVALKDWGTEIAELATKAKSLRGGGGQPAIHSPAFSLIKASLDFGQTAVATPADLDALWKSFEKVEAALRKLENTLHRV